MSEKTSSKVLEIQVANCDDYKTTVSFAGKTYQGNSSLGITEIQIEDILTEEKPLIIRLTAVGMNDFRKSLSVKKTNENSQLNKFDVRKLKLWTKDIKEASSVIVNAKDAPKVLEVEVANCNDYVVNAKLGEKTYTGNATSGKVSIEIQDIPEEEKTFVIKLTAIDKQDFIKTMKVKKSNESTQQKEFDIKRIRLWGHNIKEASSVIVNAKDAPKVLEVEVANCNDYVVNAKLGERTYTGNATSGKVSVEIQDIPEEEKTFVIELTALDRQDFIKTINVKKNNDDIALEEFDITKFELWCHNIKTVTSLVLNGKDEPKTLEVEVSNCDDYRVDVRLENKTYTADSALGKVSIEITNIPKEEKELSIKLSANGKIELTKKLIVVRKDIDFSLSSLQFWGHNIEKYADKITVYTSDMPKILDVGVSNCDEYLVSVNFNGKDYEVAATEGIAKIAIEDVPLEEKELSIKLSALGMNDFRKIIKVKKELTDALDLKVFFKSEDDNIEKEIVIGCNPKFYTTRVSGMVIIRTTNSIMSTATVNGYNISLSQDKKSATYKINITSYLSVKVEVEFENYKKAIRTFTVEKYTNQDEIPFECNNANIISGNDETMGINFDSNGEATVELNNIQYSCVKLVIEMTKSITSATLKRCKDDRSESYTSRPTADDIKGVFSGRLIKELDKNGNVIKTYTPISDKTYTEYLIIGSGTVKYWFEITSSSGVTKNYEIRIINKNEESIPENNGNDISSYYMCGYPGVTALTGKTFQWICYSKLPIVYNQGNFTELEYMGDEVKMFFIKGNSKIEGDMYFYYNVYDGSNKHEFIRMNGEVSSSKAFYTVKAVFDPQEKKVDAFVAFKSFLPMPLYPILSNIKWKKIIEKGFFLQIYNSLSYNNNGYMKTSTEIFAEIFNYRVQAKTYKNKDVLNIGLVQEYQDSFDGSAKSTKDQPFLSGKKIQIKEENGIDKYGPDDLFLMYPTFSGKIKDSIESISYTIKKNGVVESGWENVSLSPNKWSNFICLNAKDDNFNGERIQNIDTLYTYEKETNGTQNIYEIEVTIKPKNSEEEKFMYKINYKEKESINLMSLKNEPRGDYNLFGVPLSFEKFANKKGYLPNCLMENSTLGNVMVVH